MAHIPVAADAGHLFRRLFVLRNGYRVHHVLVTIPAGLLRDVAIKFGDPDRFVKAARCEVVRMPESIPRLYGVLAGKIMRRVAIVAGRDRVVARFKPAVVLVVHYVAVCARRGVVAQV